MRTTHVTLFETIASPASQRLGMIILDTNILSALMKWPPEPRLVRCLDQFAPDSIWTTSVNVFEIRVGLMTSDFRRRRK